MPRKQFGSNFWFMYRTVGIFYLLVVGMMVLATAAMKPSLLTSTRIIRIPRTVWRHAAMDHQEKIHQLLKPTLLQPHQSASSKSRQKGQQASTLEDTNETNWIQPLDPNNPVCNFLIEYYGLKGIKGTKRLARWNPNPNLLLLPTNNYRYDSLEEFQKASRMAPTNSAIKDNQMTGTGIFLEDVCEDDFATLLHLRGAILESNGALYSPVLWFQEQQRKKEQEEQQSTSAAAAAAAAAAATSKNAAHPASAFLWYRSIIQQTLDAEPILHCHGLHEWAMQYHPEGQPPPQSAKYQAHLPLRVNRQVINDTVERNGVSCTHVDALRFFAPAAGPLNHFGSFPWMQRSDQLRLEQPACVHAQMDLLKMVLRLQPFCSAELLQRVLAVSMAARRLDVAASPYDATAFGVDIVPVETEAGRALYRKEQRILMERAEPIRKELLDAYDTFLKLAFEEDPDHLKSLATVPSADRIGTGMKTR